MSSLTVPDIALPALAPEADRAVSTLEVEMLVNRLAMQVEQWKHLRATRPALAAPLRVVSRMLECACRTAFADASLWERLASARAEQGAQLREPVPRLRAGGIDRASALLDTAADRLMQLGSH